MRIAQWDILEFSRSSKHESPQMGLKAIGLGLRNHRNAKSLGSEHRRIPR